MRELSLHILDIVQNSLAAGATRICIEITEDKISDSMTIKIEDNGYGMDEETIKKALDPFYTTRTTRRVGLGLSLLLANAQACGGGLEILSHPGEGTVVKADFQLSHIDRVPLGNMVSTLIALIAGSPQVDFFYKRRVDGKAVTFNTAELKEILGETPLNNTEILAWVQDFLQEKEKELF